MAETKRAVGPVTVAAGGGTVVGYAAAKVLVWFLATLGVDAAEIEDALAVLLSVAGTVVGGWLVKPGGGKRAIE